MSIADEDPSDPSEAPLSPAAPLLWIGGRRGILAGLLAAAALALLRAERGPRPRIPQRSPAWRANPPPWPPPTARSGSPVRAPTFPSPARSSRPSEPRGPGAPRASSCTRASAPPAASGRCATGRSAWPGLAPLNAAEAGLGLVGHAHARVAVVSPRHPSVPDACIGAAELPDPISAGPRPLERRQPRRRPPARARRLQLRRLDRLVPELGPANEAATARIAAASSTRPGDARGADASEGAVGIFESRGDCGAAPPAPGALRRRRRRPRTRACATAATRTSKDLGLRHARPAAGLAAELLRFARRPRAAPRRALRLRSAPRRSAPRRGRREARDEDEPRAWRSRCASTSGSACCRWPCSSPRRCRSARRPPFSICGCTSCASRAEATGRSVADLIRREAALRPRCGATTR